MIIADKPIYITSPLLPDLAEFTHYLARIWNSGQLSNGGPMHQELETALCEYLGVEHIALFTNGTIALMTALQSLGLKGEVITTPYSFVATAHAVLWNQLTPVFVDIEPDTLNIDPAQVEKAITAETSAILPVHCYGNPCEIEAIQEIADRHNLKVIYDAAHAFGVEMENTSVLRAGDLSVLSFHATKVFNTIEGGAIVCPDAKTKARIDRLKNFGIVDETHIDEVGLNGKMSEVNAAFGLLQLEQIGAALAKRAQLAERYKGLLKSIAGLTVIEGHKQSRANNAYFPILVGPDYPLSRDQLYESMKAKGVFTRRYFHPLISDLPMYDALPSAAREKLPVASQAANQILCLPIYPELSFDDQTRVIEALL